MFDSLEDLADWLAADGIDCSLQADFLEMPIDEAELTATLQITGEWLVFKAYLGEWSPRFNDAGYSTLLLLQDRLIGLRFSIADNDLWVIQDFPTDALSEDFSVYLRSAFWVLGVILKPLTAALSRDTPMSGDEIDAMFEPVGAARLN